MPAVADDPRPQIPIETLLDALADHSESAVSDTAGIVTASYTPDTSLVLRYEPNDADSPYRETTHTFTLTREAHRG